MGGPRAGVLGVRRWLPLVPGSLLAVLVSIAAVALLDLDDHGVAVVGAIDSGLPTLGLPDGLSLDDYLDLVGPAAGVLLIGFAEGLGAAKTYAAKAGDEIDANRELLGLGTANVGSGFASGMVVNGSLSKTAVNGSAGARSQLSSVVVAAATLLTLLFLTGLFEQLPEATLAAVVIAAVIELVDLPALRRLYRVWTAELGAIYGVAARADFLAAIAAMLGVLVFDTLPGLVIGIAVSMLLLLHRSSPPHISSLAMLERSGGARPLWADRERQPEATAVPGVLVLRVESGLFFANADHVRDHVRRSVTDETRAVVLDCETMPFVDVSAVSMLVQLAADLARDDVRLLVARGVGQVRDVLRTSEAATEVGPVYPTVDAAVAAATGGSDSDTRGPSAPDS